MPSNLAMRHEVFLSYYHYDDEDYRNKFEELFGHLFINKCVRPGEIDIDNSTEYIKRLIQSHHLKDTSVIIVLVGLRTWCRKHVDWEISAAISDRVGGRSGLLGILLPTYPGYDVVTYNRDTIPPRLLANKNTGYAKLILWTADEDVIQKYVDDAFNARVDRANQMAPSQPQFRRNLCGD